MVAGGLALLSLCQQVSRAALFYASKLTNKLTGHLLLTARVKAEGIKPNQTGLLRPMLIKSMLLPLLMFSWLKQVMEPGQQPRGREALSVHGEVRTWV